MKFGKFEASAARLDLIPLIDVLFLLLAFLMITVYFEHTRADERRKLPVDALARPPEAQPDRELVLDVGFRRAADGTIDGDPVVFHRGEAVPSAEIDGHLEREAGKLLAEAENPAQSLDHVSVIIRAEADVPAGAVQELIAQCQAAKFTKFSLQAAPDEE